MSKKYLINYAHNGFFYAQKRNSESGIHTGNFDEVISYSRKDVDEDFFQRNKNILSHPRGAGYWIWKPYLIIKTLSQVDFGDYVFYCDSGSHFVASVEPLIEICNEQNIVVFNLPYLEGQWTKRDAFVLLDCDTDYYRKSLLRLGGMILVKKNNDILKFIDEYLNYCQDARLSTDIPNQCGKPNYPEFKEHRHDQSILSLLSKKWGFKSYRDLSQYGNGYKGKEGHVGDYGQIIDLTRLKA